MFCPKCGANVENGIKFCTECGTDVTIAPAPKPQPQPAAAFAQQSTAYQQPQYVQPQPAYRPAPPPQPQYAPNYQQNMYSNDAPMTTGQWMGTMFLAALPMVGFILMLVWAFSGSTNKNKKNWARATLIWGIIAGVVFTIVMIISAIAGVSLFSQFSSNMYSY